MISFIHLSVCQSGGKNFKSAHLQAIAKPDNIIEVNVFVPDGEQRGSFLAFSATFINLIEW